MLVFVMMIDGVSYACEGMNITKTEWLRLLSSAFPVVRTRFHRSNNQESPAPGCRSICPTGASSVSFVGDRALKYHPPGHHQDQDQEVDEKLGQLPHDSPSSCHEL